MALELGDDCDSNRNLDKINLKMFHVTAALLVSASLGVSEAPDCVPKQGYETMPADMGGWGGGGSPAAQSSPKNTSFAVELSFL